MSGSRRPQHQMATQWATHRIYSSSIQRQRFTDSWAYGTLCRRDTYRSKREALTQMNRIIRRNCPRAGLGDRPHRPRLLFCSLAKCWGRHLACSLLVPARLHVSTGDNSWDWDYGGAMIRVLVGTVIVLALGGAAVAALAYGSYMSGSYLNAIQPCTATGPFLH